MRVVLSTAKNIAENKSGIKIIHPRGLPSKTKIRVLVSLNDTLSTYTRSKIGLCV